MTSKKEVSELWSAITSSAISFGAETFTAMAAGGAIVRAHDPARYEKTWPSTKFKLTWADGTELT